MTKPQALYNRTTPELMALLRGGKSVKREELVDMAKWAINQEIEARDYEIGVLNFGWTDVDEMEERIEKLEEEAEEAKEEHEEEIESFKEKIKELEEAVKKGCPPDEIFL